VEAGASAEEAHEENMNKLYYGDNLDMRPFLYSASAGIILAGLLWGLTYNRIGMFVEPALVPGLTISWLLFRSQDYLPVITVTAFIYSGLAYGVFSLIRHRNHRK
jgi:hypothetical protein